MKILHTSDWHLGQSLYNFNREEEFRDFFRQLRQIIKTEKPDAMLVAGDIFDVATPSNTVVAMYNSELLRIQQENEGMQTIITAGNHDSPSRLSSAGVLWKEFGVTVVGSVPRTDGEIDAAQLVVPIRHNNETIGWVLAVPYMHSSSFPAVDNDSYADRVKTFYLHLSEIAKTKRTPKEPVIAMGHLTLANCDLTGHRITIGGQDSIPADVWDDTISYVALGHIHHSQQIGKPHIRYSGSVLPLSFDEQYKHTVTIVEFENEKMTSEREIEIIPLVDLRTVPEKAVPFEEVKKVFQNLSYEKATYLRAHILIEGIMPADMFGELSACLEGKNQLKLCTLTQEKKEEDAEEEKEDTINSLDELRTISPMDVAMKSYRLKNNEEMPDVLQECMKEAIEHADEGKEEKKR